jgi:ribosome-binding factor A
VAERVREALEQPLRVAGFDIYPTVSIGSAQAEGGLDAPDPSELLRRVELAVEQAKTAGRGGAAAYGRALESDSLSRLAMEADLRNATVHVSVLGTAAQQRTALERLEHHRRVLQAEVSKRVVLKFTPHLHFRLDESVERGSRVLDILEELGTDGEESGT